jgi:hypothetical protein
VGRFSCINSSNKVPVHVEAEIAMVVKYYCKNEYEINCLQQRRMKWMRSKGLKVGLRGTGNECGE